MAPEADPFRTLGVPPGASLNEIKSAYRRLAKQYHPDTAGERALPRFLAIQAAYERLVDGEGRLRAHGGDPWRAGGSGTSGGAGPSSGSRPRASRDAWRARRSNGSTAAGGAGTASGSKAGGRPTGQGSGAGAGPTRAGTGEPRPEGERTTRHRRGPRKATPGSTTYDDAAEIGRDPEWEGGSWYGPSMGTYWTINPREYADPRKHGPEYLARARRAAGPEAGPETSGRARGRTANPAADPAEPATDADAPDGDWAWSGGAQTTTGGDTAGWSARSWTFEASDPGPTWTPGREGRGGDRRPADRRDPLSYTDGQPLPDLETLLRRASPASLLERARTGGRRWRLALALLAWPPIAFAMGSLVLDSTGCSSYTAACPDEIRGPLLIAQLLVLGALFAVPVVAAVAAFASLAALAAALPVATILSVGSGPRAPATASILAVAVVTAYLVAFVGAAWRLWRPQRPPDPAP
jgi:curved DNA-binding protein CbpA